MIKDIVVNLKVGAKGNAASDYAISVAAALDAHLTGIIFLYGPTMPVSRAGYVPPELEVVNGTTKLQSKQLGKASQRQAHARASRRSR
jgi:hypothetical protein